ncbi:uncharacterized protein LOC126606923 [Malus sylvestris]|uniref:uncharacterized protein LOC126606923 n=1 Tax=Malus sylvestris TaxID=3752 RepID=UPI0021ABF068|nr:uncharacterized protein LOC126606923 [Malus sylvestris]
MFLSRENLQGKRTIFPSARQWSTCQYRRHRRCRFRHQIHSRRCAVQRRHSKFSTTVSLRIPARKRSPKFEKGFTRPGICWIHLCMRNVGLVDLEPTKGYHFPPGHRLGEQFVSHERGESIAILIWISWFRVSINTRNSYRAAGNRQCHACGVY